ncbi:MAG: chorismate synthase [Bacteroidetes bacterium]|nr:chorismate synthase [Bacteroidota bacterium]MBS1739709.1 chorismate synthase [Bacteroidota bacterium]
MNSFGRLFRVSIFGESHGEAVGIIIDGCPAGLPLRTDDFSHDLSRRKAGNKGTTPRKEDDNPEIISGVFEGHTTGAPLVVLFRNRNVHSADYDTIKNTPRPGHADFVLHQKFGGFNDYRGGGHSSGRLTVALTAAGVVAKKLLPFTLIQATLIEAGGDKDIDRAIANAITKQDSIGGILQCVVSGLPIGIGSPFFDSVESHIAHLIFAIPAIKGIAFGSGFSSASMPGSKHNDAILDETGKTKTNHAGGINGGMTNGNDLTFTVAVKPTSSTPKLQHTWNRTSNSIVDFQAKGRHDLCIALRVPVVVEAATAIALADLLLVSQRIDLIKPQ